MTRGINRMLRPAAAVLFAMSSSAAMCASVPNLIRDTHRAMSSLESYAFAFDVQLVLEDARGSAATIRGAVYKVGPRLRKDFEDSTYLYAPGLVLTINPREKTISCSRSAVEPRLGPATSAADLELWLADSPAFDDLGETVDGHGFALPGRTMGIARTEIYIDTTLKLPTKIVYHYLQNQTGGPASAIVRYRWTDPEEIDPLLLDPARYVTIKDGRCRASPAYRAYRMIDEPAVANESSN
jgi:hypothetical protein